MFVSIPRVFMRAGSTRLLRLSWVKLGVAMDSHEPKTLGDADLTKVDKVIALTPEAAVEARKLLPREMIEFWDVENPSDERGGRDAIIDAYRRVRDDLAARLLARFPEFHEKP